jgi:major intracellular serine protease
MEGYKLEMKLIPYTIEQVLKTAAEIPMNVKGIQAEEIWAKGEKGKGVVIAVLDTGIDTHHEDLMPNVIEGKNFTNEGFSNDFHDRNGHGTHVAGTIGACENGSGVVGVAPECKLLIGKVLSNNGSGSYESIINGIEWATNWKGPNGERVRIISMSLGGSEDYYPLNKAILMACDKGILVVVASGNEGDNDENSYEISYPSSYNECVTIGACDFNRKLAKFSNTHKQVDVIGFGVDILSTYLNNGYAVLSGTSMATPLISGALALIINIGEKAFKRELTESEIYALLTKCCCSIGYEKSAEGHGLPQLTRIYEHCK